jgi:putative membrane protein
VYKGSVRPRRRPRWQDEGEEPDYRFTLANERTFLAWVRTSLSLMAGSIAVVQLLPPFKIAGARSLLGILLALIGIGTSLFAYARWTANERAMRMSHRLAYSVALPLLTAAMGLVGVVILVLVIVERR